MLLTKHAEPESAAPGRAGLQALLTAKVAELLEMGADEVPGDVPLLELGADSIVLAELVRFIAERLRVEVELRALFEGAQTIDCLVALVDSAGATVEEMRAAAPASQGDDVAAVLTAKVAELLEMPSREVPGDVPLLELGADSIVLAELVRFIGERLGVEVELRALFEGAQTIDSLATLVSATGATIGQIPRPAPAAAPREAVPAEPNGGMASVLAAKVAELLEMPREEVAGDVPLLELGADSIVLAELVRFVGERGGVDIELRALFEDAQSIDSLAALVERAGGTFAADVAPVPAELPSAVVESAAVEAAAAPSPVPAVDVGEPDELRGREPRSGADDPDGDVEAIVQRYLRRTPRSRNLARAGKRTVCNNRRSLSANHELIAAASYPIFGSRSRGAWLTDVDGNDYVDIAMGFGVHLFGHNPPFITEALQEQMARGIHLGPEAPQLAELARNITQLTGTERVLFCNTGTEAVMTAIRVARAAGAGNKIVLFRNSYHGHFDQTLGVPAIGAGGDPRAVVGMAPGMPDSFYEDIVLLPFNSDKSIQYIVDHADEIAGVLVEPVQNRRPDLNAEAFLRKLRARTREAGIILAFDEVLVGFRIHAGGAQAYFGVEADLVAYGKVIGGGLPIGVVAGRADVMAVVDGGLSFFEPGDADPVERIYTAGTFCKNPLTAAAALASSRELLRCGNELQSALNDRTDRFVADLNRRFEDIDVPVRAHNTGSFFRFAEGSNLSFVYTPFEMDLFFLEMANNGVYMSEGGTSFLSTAHGDDEIGRLTESAVAAARNVRDAGGWRERRPIRTAPPAAVPAATAAAPAEPPPEPADEPGVLPLTAGQRLIWQAHHLDATLGAYQLRTSLELRGNLALEDFQMCLRALAERHEALRARADGPDRMIIDAEAAPFPDWVELSHLDQARHDAAVAAWFDADSAMAMDLYKDRLFRSTVLRLAPDRHILVMTLHHLIGDGVSQAVLAAEAVALLDARLAGVDPDLRPPLGLTAAMGKRAARGAEPDNGSSPAAAEPEAMAPARHPTSGAPLRLRSYRGGRLQVPLDSERKRRLVKAASVLCTTHYQLALACMFIAVARFFGEKRVVVGVSVTDRAGDEIHALVGNFSRMIAVGLDVGPDGGAAQLVPAIRAQLLSALGSSTARPVRGPLACCFNWDHYGEPSAQALQVELRDDPAGVTRFPFSLNVIEVGDSLGLEWDFSTDLFSERDIKSLSAAYVAALDSAIATGLAEEPAGLGQAATPATLMQAFEAAVRDHPDQAAVVDQAGAQTYEQLSRAVDRLAAELVARGVARNDVVALRLPADRSSLTALLAVWRAGAAFVFLDPDAPAAWADELAGRAGSRLVVTTAELGCDIGSVPQLRLEEVGVGGPTAAPLPDGSCGAGDLAYLVFTSGTTGAAKAVPIRHGQLADYANALDRRVRWQRGGRFMQVSPFFVDLGYTMWTAALLAAGTVQLPGSKAARDPLALSGFAARHRPDYAKITPSHLAAMIHMPGAEELLPSAALMFGGEPLPIGLAAQVRALAPSLTLYNHYGPAEACIGVCLFELAPEAALPAESTVPIGTAIGEVDCQLEANGEAGTFELIVEGARVSGGYWGANGADERFAGAVDGRGRFRTGDQVTRSAAGDLVFVGRKDDAGKWRGHRINPADIAAAAMLHPSVIHARVELDEAAQALRLHVALHPGAAPATAKPDLSAHVEARLPAYMRPTEIVLDTGIALSPSGKAARAAANRPDADAGDDIEPRLLALFRSAFAQPDMTADDNLFEVSSDSLQYIRLLADMKREFGRAVSLELLFDNPTALQLAAMLAAPAAGAGGERSRS